MKKTEGVQNCDTMNINDFDNKFIPKHIGNGIYVVEGFGLMCDENFIVTSARKPTTLVVGGIAGWPFLFF